MTQREPDDTASESRGRTASEGHGRTASEGRGRTASEGRGRTPADDDLARGQGTPGREERLQKVLAASGVGSRRFCEELIAQGRVTVDGRVAGLGMKVDPVAVDVRVDGERINVDPGRVYVMLNKPRGVVTTAHDPEGRPTVLDLINLPQRLFPVGRLDQDTEGLLLLTNDGELAHALTHPSFEVARTYVAQVNGRPSRAQLQRLRQGVELEDGLARARSVRLLGEGRGKSLLEVVMTEGRKREVRRMLQAADLTVERLARTAYGGVNLGELSPGKWRPLNHAEVRALLAAVEGGPRPRREERPQRLSRQDDESLERSRGMPTKRQSATGGVGRGRSDRGQARPNAPRSARGGRNAGRG